ncbi:hypothetical protein FVE85_1168 [Porphyridium purpureum]|uniref:DUF885 domain-containing protein n=1 Tax=Porphyridium purpureum TaxID=35688 RepID=A0A5J4Z0N3_PORPP|nr:hypothetical protein FVE85_1168 [Porphyridium purpureum]|eukprot:POR8132..scf208_2
MPVRSVLAAASAVAAAAGIALFFRRVSRARSHNASAAHKEIEQLKNGCVDDPHEFVSRRFVRRAFFSSLSEDAWCAQEPTLRHVLEALDRSSVGDEDDGRIRKQRNATVKLWKLYAILWDVCMADDPLVATMVGDYRFNAFVADVSRKGRDAYIDALRELLHLLSTEIDARDLQHIPQQSVNYAFLARMVRLELLAKRSFDRYELATNHLFGPHLMLIQSASFHPWRSEGDANAFLRRLRAFPTQAEQIIAACRAGIANTVVLPLRSVEQIIQQCQGMQVRARGSVHDVSVFRTAAPHFERLGVDIEALESTLLVDVCPAYARLASFFEFEYLPHAQGKKNQSPLNYSTATGQDGSKSTSTYASALAYFSSLSGASPNRNASARSDAGQEALDPAEVHALGYKEVARINEEIKLAIEELSQERDFAGKIARDASLIEVIGYLDAKPALFPRDAQQIISTYEHILENARAKMVDEFFFPSAAEHELIVKPIEPFREDSAPPAHYFPGDDYVHEDDKTSSDISENSNQQAELDHGSALSTLSPGKAVLRRSNSSRHSKINHAAIFYANTSKPGTRPLYMMPVVALHEGIPGHHTQMAYIKSCGGEIGKEVYDANERRAATEVYSELFLPRVRRQSQGFTLGFLEGWGLYAEYLGEEMGMYSTPLERLGRLLAEIWRAARLVTDTGIHHFGWSRKQAARFLRDVAVLPEAEIDAELDRYLILPGQACANKLGELKFRSLKDKAQQQLGPAFSWCEFHHVVLRHGAVPLDILEQNVDAWLASQIEKPTLVS